jgi:hypothetical protein
MGQIAIAFFTSIIVAIVTAWVTVRLSIKQFKSQRLWELRLEAYSNIINALYHFKEPYEKELEESAELIRLTDNERMELSENAKKARNDIDKTISIGILLLSQETVSILTEFRTKLNNVSSYSGDWLKEYGEIINLTNNCINTLIGQGKIDLNINTSITAQ